MHTHRVFAPMSISPQWVHNLLNELEEHLKAETMKPVVPFLIINQNQTVHFLTDSTLHFILNSVLQAGGNVAEMYWDYFQLRVHMHGQ